VTIASEIAPDWADAALVLFLDAAAEAEMPEDPAADPAMMAVGETLAGLGGEVVARQRGWLLAGFAAPAQALAAAFEVLDGVRDQELTAAIALTSEVAGNGEDAARELRHAVDPYCEPGGVLALGGAGAALQEHADLEVTPFARARVGAGEATLTLARVDQADRGGDATAFAPPGGPAGGRSAGGGEVFPAPGPATDPGTSGNGEEIGPGFVLSHTYEIVELIGHGGMGTVYRARHLDLGTEHAIKIVSPEHAADERILGLFRREAESLRRVRHDAVVSHDGVIRDEHGRLYLVMEYVRGPSLAEVTASAPLGAGDTERLFERIALGLQAAHDKGIVHRDLSPDNIILCDGDVARAKIIDFGIARDLQPGTRTLIGSDFAGKCGYASPEQLGLFGGAVDHRSDIYSLGLVMAKALGQRIDAGRTLAEAVEKRQTLPDLTGVSEPWRTRLSAMLQPDPADRPASLRAMAGAGAASAAPASRPPAAGGQGGRSRPAPTGGGRKALVLGLAALLLAGLAGGGAYWFLAAGPDPMELRRQVAAAVDERLQQPDCGYVAPEVVTTANGAVSLTLTGVAGRPEAVRRIEDSVAGLAGLSGVVNRMHVYAPPFCRVLAELRGFQGAAGTPELRLNQANGTYRDGERLILEVQARMAGAQYLYVDYIDGDGAVAHLLPNEAAGDNRVQAGDSRVLGDGPEGTSFRVYRAAPPYGDNLLLAVASSTELFDGLRPEVEPLAKYLPRLQAALAEAQESGAQTAVGRIFFTTEP